MHASRILLLPAWLLLISLQISKAQIPASMLLKMASMRSTKDFMLHMVVNNERSLNVTKGSVEDLMFTDRGNVDPDGVDTAVSQVADPEICTPTMKPVNLPADPDPTVVYFPNCVKMQLCGGCCPGDMLECAPRQASVKTVTVYRIRYPYVGATSLEFEGLHNIEMEMHLACECRCRVQAYHCNTAIQTYAPEECRCRCKNEDQATSCPLRKIWDESKCKCVCSKTPDCLPGEVFRTETCRCENTTPAPPSSHVYDPCGRKKCKLPFVPRKMSAYSCKCALASSLPRRSRSLTTGTRQHITDRFPMMRAGVFDRH